MFASPVEIFPGGAPKRVDDASYAALFSSAGIVKVKHALNCFKLSSVNDGTSFFGEQIIDIAILVVYMSSSVLQLAVGSPNFLQATEEITVCKAEKIYKMTTQSISRSSLPNNRIFVTILCLFTF